MCDKSHHLVDKINIVINLKIITNSQTIAFYITVYMLYIKAILITRWLS